MYDFEVWPWDHLGLSTQGIPASQVCPEHKAKKTQRSVLQPHTTNNDLSISPLKGAVCSLSRGCCTKQTNNWCQNKKKKSFKKRNDPQNNEVSAASKASYYLQESLGHLCLFAVITCGLHFWETADWSQPLQKHWRRLLYCFTWGDSKQTLLGTEIVTVEFSINGKQFKATTVFSTVVHLTFIPYYTHNHNG